MRVGDGLVDGMVFVYGEDVFWFFPWEYGGIFVQEPYQLCFKVLWWWVECS